MSVSVIMPVRNVAATVEAAISSVLVSREVEELLVYDDASTDATPVILASLEDPRIKVFRDVEGLRFPLTMNYLFERAAAPYVALCDGDDLYVEGRLEKQVDFLNRQSEFVAVSSAYRSMTSNGRPVAPLADIGQPRDVTEDLLSGRVVTSLCTFLTRNEPLRRTGYFRDWFENASDLDLQFRLARIGRVWHDPTVYGLHYRLHDASLTHTMAVSRRWFFDRCAVEFAHQRASTGTDDLMRGTPPVPPEKDDRDAEPFSVRDQIAGQIEGAAWREADKGHHGAALRGIMRAIAWKPTSPRLWRSLAAVAVKPLKRRG